jgi:hypothetical protein
VPAVPAARRLAGGGGGQPPVVVPGRDLLGPAHPRLRRPRRQGGRGRPGPRRPRRQPDRPGLHRRPVGRLAVPGDAPGWLRQPAAFSLGRRRAAPDRRLDHSGGALRPSRQQADDRGARRLRRLPAARAGRAGTGCHRGPRFLRLRSGLANPAGAGDRSPDAPPEVRPRRGGRHRRPGDPLLLPPQPAEHLHRQAHDGIFLRARDLAAL